MEYVKFEKQLKKLNKKGKYTATVKFAGEDDIKGSSAKVTVTVKKATPKLTVKSKSFKASVKTSTNIRCIFYMYSFKSF